MEPLSKPIDRLTMKTWKKFTLRDFVRETIHSKLNVENVINNIQNDFELKYKKDLNTDYECEYLVYYQDKNNIDGYKNRYLYHYGKYDDGEQTLPDEIKSRYEKVRNNSSDNFLKIFNNNSEQRVDKMPTIEELRKQLAEAESAALTEGQTAIDALITNSSLAPLELLDIMKKTVLPCDKYMEAFRMLALDKIKIVATGEFWAPKGKEARLPETLRDALRKAQGEKDVREITLNTALADVVNAISGLGKTVELIGHDVYQKAASSDGQAALIRSVESTKTKTKRSKQIGGMAVDGKDLKIQID